MTHSALKVLVAHSGEVFEPQDGSAPVASIIKHSAEFVVHTTVATASTATTTVKETKEEKDGEEHTRLNRKLEQENQQLKQQVLQQQTPRTARHMHTCTRECVCVCVVCVWCMFPKEYTFVSLRFVFCFHAD